MRATSVDLVHLGNKYFLLGYSYHEILQYLASFNGITLSLRQLNRILRSLDLFRRHHNISPNITLHTVQEELRGSRGGIWGFIPPQFFGSENYLKCLS